MLQGYVGAEIRRTNRNLLVTNVVLAALVLSLPVIFWGYVAECLGGPYPTTLEAIAGLNSVSDAPHRYVKFDIDPHHLERSGFHITDSKGEQNDHFHFLRLSNGHVFIIVVHGDDVPETIVGELSNLTSDVNDTVLPGVADDIKDPVLPVMVDTASYTGGFHVMIGLGAPLLLLCVWNILKAVRRMGDPLKSRIAASLAKVGPPEEMAVAVDAEVAEGGKTVGRVVATRSWLIQSNTFDTDLVYLGDVAWAYKSETKHKSYGVTTSRTYATVLYDVHGRRYSFALTQNQVDTLLQELAARVPWAIIGYSADRLKAWGKNRSAVLEEVAQRKKRVTDAGGNPPPV